MSAETDPLAALDFTPVYPCQSSDHARGRNGCDPNSNADYIVEFDHMKFDPVRGVCIQARAFLCLGAVIRIRSRANEGARCPDCDESGTFRDFVRVIDPIVAPSP